MNIGFLIALIRPVFVLGLLFCLFCSRLSVAVADDSIIYIRGDGTVEGTDEIERDGNVYTLTGNVSSTLYVQKSNIVIDGAGFGINGMDLTNGVGQNPSNPTIHNVTIQNLFMANGVVTNGGGNHTFYNNCFGSILFRGSDFCNITYCELGGITLDYGSDNNTVVNNNLGGALEFLSSDNTVDKNYWNDYLTKYPNATEIENTGIYNQPYVYSIVGTSTPIIYQDKHPLTEPVEIPLLDSSSNANSELPKEDDQTTLVIGFLIAIIVAGLVLLLYKKRN